MLDRRGRAIVNPSPPRCDDSPCRDPVRGGLRPRFTDEDLAVWRRWRLCRAFKTLPTPGALCDQNPWEMARYEVLERHERDDEAKRQAMLAGVRLTRG